MSININLQVVPFGQIVFKTDSPVYEVHEPLPSPVKEALQYHEPQQTVPVVYEIIYYEQQLTNFTVPSSTTYS
ncbi:MAG TPA: hypothetical protein VKB35_07890 [Ktedonobacteraceae bacterium]|nr:hypothetical protein [Ktedonobacteraceae bacterium]